MRRRISFSVSTYRLLLALGPHLVQRRLRNVDHPAIDQDRHLAEQERQEQRANVRAVDVRIRHQNDLAVAAFLDVEFVRTDPGSERTDHGPDLLVTEHFLEARLLHVQDLAPQRENRLDRAIAAPFGRPAGGIALDDEDLRRAPFAAGTVPEFAGQIRIAQGALAARQLTRLARRLARRRRLDLLVENPFRFGWVFEIMSELVVHHGSMKHRPGRQAHGSRSKCGSASLTRRPSGPHADRRPSWRPS